MWYVEKVDVGCFMVIVYNEDCEWRWTGNED